MVHCCHGAVLLEKFSGVLPHTSVVRYHDRFQATAVNIFNESRQLGENLQG